MEEVKVDKKYSNHIERLISQISPMFPDDIKKLQQDYLINNIRRSSTLLAKSMQEDEIFKSLDFERQCIFIQIMAEWSFHKEIDLFRSGIPPKYWKTVMQKIWYTIWEVMYACIQNNAPDNVVLNIVERYVNRTYKDAVEELKNANAINEDIEEKAIVQSNIEVMANRYIKERQKQKMNRFIRLFFIMVIAGSIVTFMVLNFKMVGVIVILTFMVVYNLVSTGENK